MREVERAGIIFYAQYFGILPLRITCVAGNSPSAYSLEQIVEQLPIKSQRDAASYAESYCDRLIAAFDKKARHNKNESLWWFGGIIVCTTTAPLFITLGDGVIWAKAVPSVLSAIAAGGTAWLQLRKPQQLWAMYRTAHRELEDQKARYDHQLGSYANESERHKILAEHAADIAIGAHYDWLPVVPNVSQLHPDVAGSGAKARK